MRTGTTAELFRQTDCKLYLLTGCVIGERDAGGVVHRAREASSRSVADAQNELVFELVGRRSPNPGPHDGGARGAVGRLAGRIVAALAAVEHAARTEEPAGAGRSLDVVASSGDLPRPIAVHTCARRGRRRAAGM